jgi:hypothetical protein
MPVFSKSKRRISVLAAEDVRRYFELLNVVSGCSEKLKT